MVVDYSTVANMDNIAYQALYHLVGRVLNEQRIGGSVFQLFGSKTNVLRSGHHDHCVALTCFRYINVVIP